MKRSTVTEQRKRLILAKVLERIAILLFAVAFVRFVSVCIGRERLVTDRTDEEGRNAVVKSIADFWR